MAMDVLGEHVLYDPRETGNINSHSHFARVLVLAFLQTFQPYY